jgi:tetratricopeptide (TPR) repeat protein
MNGRINMKRLSSAGKIIFILFFQFFLLFGTYAQQVKVWEEDLVMKTYLMGKDEKNPVLPEPRGEINRIYPYPMQDYLMDNAEDKNYCAVFLENEFIKVCMTPGLGGYLHDAYNKTNNQPIFYHNHVVKPALIGPRGAWISGGIEWKYPAGHRLTVMMPVDYEVIKNNDGSVTCVVGETELRHRTRWIVSITIEPGKSYIRQDVKLINRTAFPIAFEWWANAAVHVSGNYQVIFPANVTAFHGKTRFYPWPVINGTDYSIIRNNKKPWSFFDEGSTEDYFGGYNHDKKAGTVHIADHRIVRGKKFFTWGTADDGLIWDEILTDSDGSYIELQAGGYADNQPSYEWLSPFEVKSFTEYWYPIKNIGAFKRANLDAIVNLEEKKPNKLYIAFNTTQTFNNAKIILTQKGKEIFTDDANISPEKSYEKDIDFPNSAKMEDLKISLFSSNGKLLIDYQPKPPKPFSPPEKKKEKQINDMSNDELMIRAKDREKFGYLLNAIDIYNEILKREEDNALANNALGIIKLNQGFFDEAEKHFSTAIRKNPDWKEPYYYLGQSLLYQGKIDEAYNRFYRSIYDLNFFSGGNYFLGQIDCYNKDYLSALKHLSDAVSTNTLFTKAYVLKSIALRKLQRFEDAENILKKSLEIDPIDFWGMYELKFLKRNQNQPAESINQKLREKMRDEYQSYLEAAVDYANAGLFEEAIVVLEDCKKYIGADKINPMVLYHLGYYYKKIGKESSAKENYLTARERSRDYVFPHRLESMDVLKDVVNNYPEDARALYYMGNLLYSKNHYQEGIKYWEKSAELEKDFSVIFRNLGFGYDRYEKNSDKALKSYLKSAELNPEDPKILLELDRIYERIGKNPEERLSLLQKNQETVMKRSDLLGREIELLIQANKFDKAIQLLTTYHFINWEGGYAIHDTYVYALVGRGDLYFKNGEYEKAAEDYKSALLYPRNLGVGKPFKLNLAKLYYKIGSAYEKFNKDAAKEYWKKAAEEEYRLVSENNYFKGMCLKNLGRNAESLKLFDELIAEAKKILSANNNDAIGHYLLGLGYKGKGDESKAESEINSALSINKNIVRVSQRRAEAVFYELDE